jgi:hypothetical protein
MMIDAERHAKLLLWCYPGVWRERYGDELEALLIDEFVDQPRSLRRDLDVVRAGLLARLSACGLTRGPVLNPAVTALVAVAAACVFVASALSIWTQLADGWLSAPPDRPAVTVGLITLSVWLGGLAIAAAALGVRMVPALVRAIRDGRAVDVLRPSAVLVASAAVFIAGVRLVAPRWPNAPVVHHDGALVHAARVGWAATDSISTFWLHAHLLLTRPVDELVWMMLSPLAVTAFLWSVLRLVRASGVHLPRRPAHAGTLAGIALMPCFVTAAAWVLGSQHAASASYRAGTLDLALIVVMVTSTYVARNAMRLQRQMQPQRFVDVTHQRRRHPTDPSADSGDVE